MCWNPTKNLPLKLAPRRSSDRGRKLNEFFALAVICKASSNQTKSPSSATGTGTDAFAFHGRPGAQVALLQSPILPAVNSVYIKKQSFRGLPVDKPHTRISRFTSPSVSAYSAMKSALFVFLLTPFSLILSPILPRTSTEQGWTDFVLPPLLRFFQKVKKYENNRYTNTARIQRHPNPAALLR